MGIDGLAGPSELVVVATAGADPELVALDLLAQAEHGEDCAAGADLARRAACCDAVVGALERAPSAERARCCAARS